ncbi:unnamed protein product [Fraxinus pennsylvanica]|uniref:Fiber protein Fb34 n=1 Tax=Fraxinus pennsylvanica TaxID=56036 RepID=A0AAD2AG38_9LAMI|nr:unnamed protein product [Fraxinus pennsylvanica]
MASKLLMIIVFVFDLISFALAVAAEQRRSTATIKLDNESNYNYCVYDSDISTGFGVGAFFFLMASQALVMFTSRCFCCGKALSPGSSRACAVLLFGFCWVTFFIAEVCLLAGSVRNAYHTKYRTRFFENPPSCETVRKGVFAAGASFIFFTGIISEFYYISYYKALGSPGPFGGEAGIGMGLFK